MNTLELFCGTKSFSKVAAKRGHDTFTTDNDPQFNADWTVDIMAFVPPPGVDIVWASPPCESFSVASIGHHWHPDHTPKTQEAVIGVAVLTRAIEVIAMAKPTYWFIENPRGKMRKVIDPIIRQYLGDNYKRHTVCYCRYGDTRMKPTDIWTNSSWVPVNRLCYNGCTDHESAPRGARTGTQGINGYRERSVIPPALFEDIFDQIK